MSNVTPATLSQSQKLLALVSGHDASSRQVQNLLANGDLVKMLLDAPDLSKVSREKLQAVLAPPPQVIDWTPVHQYADKLREWSEQPQLSFSLSDKRIADLALPDHAGPYRPTSITLTYGMGLEFDLKVVAEILEYELDKLGVSFTDYMGKNDRMVEYYPGSEPEAFQLSVALLDIGYFWDPQNSVSAREVRKKLAGKPLPGLEVYWLMALNAQVFAAIDYEAVPGFITPGFVTESHYVPVFCRGSDGMYVSAYRDSARWYDASVVVFREC